MKFVTSNGSETINVPDDTVLSFGNDFDWKVFYDEAGDNALILEGTSLQVATDTATFFSANANDPLVIIKNTTNDASGARLQLVKDKGAAGAANDVNGLIQFIGDDANQDQVMFSEIKSQVKVHTNGRRPGYGLRQGVFEEHSLGLEAAPGCRGGQLVDGLRPSSLRRRLPGRRLEGSHFVQLINEIKGRMAAAILPCRLKLFCRHESISCDRKFGSPKF